MCRIFPGRAGFFLNLSSRDVDPYVGGHRVKIQSTFDTALAYMNRVREKADKDGSQGHSNPSPDREKRREEPEELEVTDDRVNQALREFTAETLGVTAAQEGNGPGLRVMLRDPNGKLIRQLTGEEFLRLRDAAKSGPPARPGKILDKKM